MPDPVRRCQRHLYTLDDLRARCGAQDDDECWDCYVGMHGAAPRSEKGKRYPVVKHGGVLKVLVRRLAWFLAFGEDPPEGMFLVMAKCANPRCQNPHHASPMFEKQKSEVAGKRGALSSPLKRRKIAATKQRQSKLAGGMETARAIRADETPARLEPWKRYGISQSMYWMIRRNETWIDYAMMGPFQLAA